MGRLETDLTDAHRPAPSAGARQEVIEIAREAGSQLRTLRHADRMASWRMQGWDYVGLMGGVVISVMYIPQIWKSYRTKSTGDLSWLMLFVYFFGLSLIGAYAIALTLWPIVLPWIVEILLLFVQVAMKFVFDRRSNPDESRKQEGSAAAPQDQLMASTRKLQARRGPA